MCVSRPYGAPRERTRMLQSRYASEGQPVGGRIGCHFLDLDIDKRCTRFTWTGICGRRHCKPARISGKRFKLVFRNTLVRAVYSGRRPQYGSALHAIKADWFRRVAETSSSTTAGRADTACGTTY